MTSIFDGMAGALNDVFGAPVVYRGPGGAAEVTIRSVFRREPVEELGEGGTFVVVHRPTWDVPKAHATGIGRGGEIVPGDGRWYRVLRRVPSVSPAADAFVRFDLEEVT